MDQSQAGDGAGPSASKGPTSATSGSANLGTRGRQSSATGLSTSPMTALRIVQRNAEGIQQKKTELQAFLKENNIDVICIQATHLTESRRFFIRGYKTFRRDRPTGHKGGVIILVRHGIPALLIEQTAAASELEFVTIKILLQDEELLFTNCYSPPTSRLDLHTIQLLPENHIIVGDFNGHSSSWGMKSYTAEERT